VDGAEGSGQSVLGHLRHFCGLSFGQRDVGGHNPQGGMGEGLLRRRQSREQRCLHVHEPLTDDSARASHDLPGPWIHHVTETVHHGQRTHHRASCGTATGGADTPFHRPCQAM